LSQISLKRIELIVLACLIQAGLIFLGSKKVKFISDYSSFMIIFSYVVLLSAVWSNLKLEGMKIIVTGIMLNFIVIMVNGGHMPVLLNSLYKAELNDFALVLKEGIYVTHTLITEKNLICIFSRYFPLIFPISWPFSGKRRGFFNVLWSVQLNSKCNVEKRNGSRNLISIEYRVYNIKWKGKR